MTELVSDAGRESPSVETEPSAEHPPRTSPITLPLRRLGQTDDLVFPLAISGNVFGWTADAEQTDAILDRYHALGGDFIDTADSYAGGRSEIMIGRWMRRRGVRDRVTVATKIGKGPDHRGLSAPAVTAAVHDSLRRLGTDRIDLLYLHVDDPTVPFEETLLAVDSLVRAGLVRHVGCAHHSADRLIEARVASAQLGVVRLAALQNEYNLLQRTGYESRLAPVARAQGLGVMPRFALASGFLTGKYRSRADIPRDSKGRDVAVHLGRRGTRVLQALDRVASAHGVPVAGVALAWLLSKPAVVAPVVSASRPEQVDDLMTAPRLELSRHQITELDRASA